MDVLFNNTSAGAVAYAWDFGDGATAIGTSPTHTFINTGASIRCYTVSLIASTAFGCSDTAVFDITVAPPVSRSSSMTPCPDVRRWT
jgi:PKD repeat protein